jgi:hypothetical protein
MGWLVPAGGRHPIMIIRYTPCPVRTPVPGLGGLAVVPRPIVPVLVTGPTGSRLRDGLLDTGADETILEPSMAPSIGVDLSTALQREVNLYSPHGEMTQIALASNEEKTAR